MTKKIMLDPGHGGRDPGSGANGLKEKDLVLKIAKKTKAILLKRCMGHQLSSHDQLMFILICLKEQD